MSRGRRNKIVKMILNRYEGFFSKIRGKIKDRFPEIYDKIFKKIIIGIVVKKQGPIIQERINKLISTKPFPIFEQIEIETINRCNNTCSFCPVNRNIDTRPYKLMDEKLFIDIVRQLNNLNYSGIVGLFSNNEPFLDNRIFEFARIARELVPRASLRIMTNGLLMSVEKLNLIMKYLDILVIDNYQDDLGMTKQTKEIYDYCLNNNIYQDKLQIWLRKKSEILTTRAGQAKNREEIKPLACSCDYPFTQFVIRPDGKVSLCCNDALGIMTLGDLNQQTITEIWNGETFQEIRKKLLMGRKNIKLCSQCDGRL